MKDLDFLKKLDLKIVKKTLELQCLVKLRNEFTVPKTEKKDSNKVVKELPKNKNIL